ncbi:hypothetical protein YPPY102_1762, partial [Yersinia pestis PY-102]
MDKSVVLQRE